LDIRNRNVPLAIWKREIPEEITNAMRSWLKPHDCIVEEKIRVDQQDVRGLIAARLAENEWNGSSENGDWLIDDLTDLVYRFSEAADTSSILFRLESLRDAGCCKFHVHHLPRRMLCTYFGPGTEGAPGEAVCREEIGCIADSIETANRRIIPDADSIQQAPTGAVLLFKGNLYPGEKGNGLVHRSAPVSGPDHTRLLLRIDPLKE
jgi:hypothetical protein